MRPGRSFPVRLGRYDLVLPIASGGMATVYFGELSSTAGFTREVAIKLLHPHLRSEGDESSLDLLSEARLAGRIRHPNAVGALDVGDSEWGLYLVMEYVEGPTLSQLLRRAAARDEGLPPPIALRILVDLLAGLHAAHELTDDTGQQVGLVHRDVSPQNVLIGIDGTARLTDFGIAKVTTSDAATRTGLVKGKAGYMAPEQLRGGPLDRRCDVWAAGVLGWEMLAGRRLFFADEPLGIALKIVQQPIPKLAVADPITEALDSALQRVVRERCESAVKLRTQLLESGAPIADPAELARYVEQEVGDDLRAFRARVQEAKARSARAASEVNPASTELASLDAKQLAQEVTTARSSTAVPETGGSFTSETLELKTVPSHRATEARSSLDKRNRAVRVRLGTFALAVVALGAGLAWSVIAEEGAPHETSADAEPTAAPRATGPDDGPTPGPDLAGAEVASPEVATPEGAAPTSGDAEPERLPKAVRLRADAAIAQVWIGTRLISPATPSVDITVELTDDERAADPWLRLIASDGRQLKTRAAEVTDALKFPKPSQPSSPPPSKPVLAETPYGNSP